MPEDQNQNTQFNPATNDPAGAGTNPNQNFDNSFDTTPQQGAQPAYNEQFSTTPAEPAGDYNQSFNNTFDSTFSQPTDDSTHVPPLDQQFPNNGAPEPNTFEQKKTGSRIFVIGSSVVVVILLAAIGVLIYFNFFANSDTTDSVTDTTAVVDQAEPETEETNTEPEVEEEEEVVVDEGSTGGSSTPASQARVNSESDLPTSWLSQKFTTPAVDTTGNCLNIAVCGEQADPDNDGATNIVEYNFNLDPLEADTDRDDLADGDELFVYFTDPSSEASDSDNFSDSAELGNCYDPTEVSSSKMTTSRRNQIASNVTLRPLHQPTISFLQDAGATQSDITNRAVPVAACPTDDGTTTDTTTDTSTDATETVAP